jgi:hypothetical protein
MENKKAVLTIREVSKEYSFPEFGLRTLVKTGAFPVIRCGNRCYIARSVFEGYLEKGGEVYNAKR